MGRTAKKCRKIYNPMLTPLFYLLNRWCSHCSCSLLKLSAITSQLSFDHSNFDDDLYFCQFTISNQPLLIFAVLSLHSSLKITKLMAFKSQSNSVSIFLGL